MNDDAASPSTPPAPSIGRRSVFVTSLAWTSIALAGGATIIAAMQAAVWFLFMRDKFAGADLAFPGVEKLPPVVRYVVSHPELYFVVFWSLTVLTLIAAIGLLRRRNWARLYFVAVLALGIAWQLAGMWIQRELHTAMTGTLQDIPRDAADAFASVQTVIEVGTTVVVFALIVLFAWLIKRLVSKEVRAEFGVR